MDINNRELKKRIRKIKKKIKKIKWFPSYQSFSELGIKGRRNDNKRYRFLDFSEFEGKFVVDYGCNIGQTCIKVAKAGAKRVIGFDSQEDSLQVAREIRDVLFVKNLEFYKVDFNDPDFEDMVLRYFHGQTPDISFFLSVYRTKELKDRDGLFRFILENTKEKVYFEGHSVKTIDTVDYYMNIFKKFGVTGKFLGYSQGETRPFFVININGN